MIHETINMPPRGYVKNAAADIDQIVRKHSGMVRKIAWQVHSGMSSAVAIDDLMQIGLMALVEAARGFVETGAAFAPYAATRVRGAMIDQLRREAKIGRQGMANRRRLASTRSTLENRLCRAASDAEMAEALGVEVADYHALVTSCQPLQFDAMDEVYSDSSMWFADLADTPEQILLDHEVEEQLAGAIAILDERSAMVLQLYFKEGLNLAEIAETLCVSAPRSCQIKRDALDRVRTVMTASFAFD
jgi:RNA polymerase sigma factor FliA